jgi:hypothetical protein
VKVHPEFAKKDTVQLMGLGIGEEEKVVADAIVINVVGGSLYGVPICEGQVSVIVVKSYSDEYILFKRLDLNSPPITKVGEAIGEFVLWPIEFVLKAT